MKHSFSTNNSKLFTISVLPLVNSLIKDKNNFWPYYQHCKHNDLLTLAKFSVVHKVLTG